MGCESGIHADRFPSQGSKLGQRVRVCFWYKTSEAVDGTVVRDDRESPYRTIIQLDDGRFVLDTECQYSMGWVRAGCERDGAEMSSEQGPTFKTAPALEDVMAERRNQDQQWGGPDHDDYHSPVDWMSYIRHQLRKLQGEGPGDIIKFRLRMIKVAALAVAAIEYSDRALTAIGKLPPHEPEEKP